MGIKADYAMKLIGKGTPFTKMEAKKAALVKGRKYKVLKGHEKVKVFFMKVLAHLRDFFRGKKSRKKLIQSVGKEIKQFEDKLEGNINGNENLEARLKTRVEFQKQLNLMSDVILTPLICECGIRGHKLKGDLKTLKTEFVIARGKNDHHFDKLMKEFTSDPAVKKVALEIYRDKIVAIRAHREKLHDKSQVLLSEIEKLEAQIEDPNTPTIAIPSFKDLIQKQTAVLMNNKMKLDAETAALAKAEGDIEKLADIAEIKKMGVDIRCLPIGERSKAQTMTANAEVLKQENKALITKRKMLDKAIAASEKKAGKLFGPKKKALDKLKKTRELTAQKILSNEKAILQTASTITNWIGIAEKAALKKK